MSIYVYICLYIYIYVYICLSLSLSLSIYIYMPIYAYMCLYMPISEVGGMRPPRSPPAGKYEKDWWSALLGRARSLALRPAMRRYAPDSFSSTVLGF